MQSGDTISTFKFNMIHLKHTWLKPYSNNAGSVPSLLLYKSFICNIYSHCCRARMPNMHTPHHLSLRTHHAISWEPELCFRQSPLERLKTVKHTSFPGTQSQLSVGDNQVIFRALKSMGLRCASTFSLTDILWVVTNIAYHPLISMGLAQENLHRPALSVQHWPSNLS